LLCIAKGLKVKNLTKLVELYMESVNPQEVQRPPNGVDGNSGKAKSVVTTRGVSKDELLERFCQQMQMIFMDMTSELHGKVIHRYQGTITSMTSTHSLTGNRLIAFGSTQGDIIVLDVANIEDKPKETGKFHIQTHIPSQVTALSVKFHRFNGKDRFAIAAMWGSREVYQFKGE
jgi:hypothetical protein